MAAALEDRMVRPWAQAQVTQRATDGYTMDGLAERAAAALADERDYIDELLARSDGRRVLRRKHGVPTLAFLGRGRSGKDTTAEYVGACTGLKYAGSSSNVLGRFVARMVGVSYEQAFAERHAHREWWIQAGHAIRHTDPTLLCRLVLGAGDMAVGLRGRIEIHRCVEEGVVDALVWLDRDVPPDGTMELSADDCDVVVPNRGSYVELYRRLDTLIRLFGLDRYRETK